MRRRVLLLSTALVLAVGCKKDPQIEERAITLHVPAACAFDASQAYSIFVAAGDFDPADEPGREAVFLREAKATLAHLPAASKALVVDVSQNAQTLDWRGVTVVPPSGPVDVLLWPTTSACRLSADVERRSDTSIGAFGTHFVLVAGGKTKGAAQVPHTYVADLSTGTVTELQFGLGTLRSRPSITPFGDGGALVAGGTDPDSGEAIGTAEVYTPAPGGTVGDFERARIELDERRGNHGAAVLGSGETLLVGGSGASGPLRTMEIVDPKTKRSRTSGVALLAAPRANPTVLRLASGEILVAGGTDASGAALTKLEWFSPDVSRASKPPRDLEVGKERAFVALDQGGALAVIAPEVPSAAFKSVWLITAEGELESATPIVGPDKVRLFEGTDGAPLLFTGTRWMRWQPWRATFQNVSDAPAAGPALDAYCSPDRGLALWLEDGEDAGMFLRGYRFGTRGPFANVPRPLLTTGPEYLAPDRLTDPIALHFDAATGLVLQPGASAFITDATYAAVTVDVVAALGAAPAVVLRDASGVEVEIGSPSCPAPPARNTVHVERDGAAVKVNVDGGPARACTRQIAPGARVSVGLRGAVGTDASAARALLVVRR